MKRYLIAVFALAACGGGTATATTETTPPPAAPEESPPVEPAEEPEADPTDVHIEGDHLTIDRHINFATDSNTILEDSFELLDHIALMIKHHTDVIAHLKIIGHTDESGGHDHNQELSEQRAAAVEQALRDRGVEIELEHSGVGETEPTCEEDTDECHAANRRVEFLIMPATGGDAAAEEPVAQ